MAKKTVKSVVHTEAYATKDTFWNHERVVRGIAYRDIAKKTNKSIGTICQWFIGRTRPDKDTIKFLCDYFNEDKNCMHISYAQGELEFDIAFKNYKANRNGNKIVCRSDKTETKEVIKNFDTGLENRNIGSISFLLKQRHVTYKQLAHELKCTVTMIRRWVKGLDVPNDVYISKMADFLEYDADKLSDLFEKAYRKYRNIEGQIDISDVTKPTSWRYNFETGEMIVEHTEKPEVDISFSPEVEDALKKMADHHDDHERFVKWFNILSSISPARITEEEIVNIMSQYVCCNYNMFNALEAWHNECKTNYVHERYILLACERRKWLGEDYER